MSRRLNFKLDSEKGYWKVKSNRKIGLIYGSIIPHKTYPDKWKLLMNLRTPEGVIKNGSLQRPIDSVECAIKKAMEVVDWWDKDEQNRRDLNESNPRDKRLYPRSG